MSLEAARARECTASDGEFYVAVAAIDGDDGRQIAFANELWWFTAGGKMHELGDRTPDEFCAEATK